MTSFEFLIPRLFRLEMDLPSWTLWKWIVYSLLMICWIAFGNILLIELLNPGRQLYWQTWLFSMVPQTLAIGVFPTTFYGLLIQMRASKKNQIEAERMDIVTSFGSKKKLTFALSQHCSRTLDEDQLLYVRSMQNYVALMYWDGEKVEKIIVRSTLQGLYKELSSQSDGIEQCHRSFLVLSLIHI